MRMPLPGACSTSFSSSLFAAWNSVWASRRMLRILVAPMRASPNSLAVFLTNAWVTPAFSPFQSAFSALPLRPVSALSLLFSSLDTASDQTEEASWRLPSRAWSTWSNFSI